MVYLELSCNNHDCNGLRLLISMWYATGHIAEEQPTHKLGLLIDRLEACLSMKRSVDTNDSSVEFRIIDCLREHFIDSVPVTAIVCLNISIDSHFPL